MQSKASLECIKCTTLRAPRQPSYNNMYIREDEDPTAEKNRQSAAPAVPENVKIRTGAVSYDSGWKRPSKGLWDVQTMSAVCTISELSMISFLFYHS